jgi:tyrosyl-tRNA synthetase
MHLTEDALKNPCLDYVQHILFSVPGATFTAGGQAFASADAVRAAFTSGALSEASLKDALVAAVNGLLQPVRTHFQTDAEAKRILELISGWMA